MAGFGILMIILGIGIILAGLYTYTGHYSELLFWRSHMKNVSKEYLNYVGKVTMCVGLSPIISGILGLNMEEDSIIPVIALLGLFILLLFGAINVFKVKDKEINENEDIKK